MLLTRMKNYHDTNESERMPHVVFIFDCTLANNTQTKCGCEPACSVQVKTPKPQQQVDTVRTCTIQ